MMQIEMREGLGTEEGIELAFVEGDCLYVRGASGADVCLPCSELREEELKEARELTQRVKEMRRAVDGLYWRIAAAAS